MGSERAGKRKHLFLCFACSMIISLATEGCVHFHITQEGEEDLARARSLMSQRLFEVSFRESQEVLRRYHQSQGDQALFLMGLIYLHPQNPNSDYKKSLGYFQRLEREFPDSQLRSEAEIWISVLQKSLKTEEDIKALNELLNLKEKEIARKKQEINKLSSQVESLQNQREVLQRLTGELDQQIKDLQKQIKQLKEIDLGIEEKRRDALQK
jgi:peptidoglycan hydrolase CwlO-like protein